MLTDSQFMNQKESYKPHFNRALILGNNFVILIFVQQYSTLGIETKVVKGKNTKNIHCSWKSHIYMVTKSWEDLLSKVHFSCVCFFVFFCCPAITFVKLITLGWIFIFYWKRTLFLLLVCFGLHKNVEKRASNWSSVNLIERLQALCTRCAREVIFNGSLPTFSLWLLSQVQRWQSSHFNSSKILRRRFQFFST